MGLGILSTIKSFAPLFLYVLGVVLFFRALTGKVHHTLLFVVFLLPLRNVVERLHGFPLGEKFLTMLILGMMIGWFLLGASRKIKLMENSPLNVISLVLIFYTFVSLQIGNQYLGFPFFNTGDPRVQDWKNFCLMPLLFFITFNTTQDKKSVWQVFIAMCAAMLLSAYYTSTQVSWFSALVSRAKITGTFNFLGPNEVAAFFNQYTIILAAVFYSLKRGLAKTSLMALIALNLFCVLFLYSRAAYLAIFVGLNILFALKDKKLLAVLIFAALFWQIALPAKVQERISQTTDEFGELADVSAERRLSVWSLSMELFQDSPITGLGFGVFRHLGFDLGDTHNIYIKILVEQGLIGLFIFIILMMCFLKEGFILYQKGDDNLSKGLGLGLMLSIVVLLINNFFGDRWSYLELGSYLWIFAGLVARLRVISLQAQTQKAPFAKSNKSVKTIKKAKPHFYK